jgi:hypothetical protein
MFPSWGFNRERYHSITDVGHDRTTPRVSFGDDSPGCAPALTGVALGSSLSESPVSTLLIELVN